MLEKFLKYIWIPTNSSYETEKKPSTESKWNLARVLVEELKN